MKTQFAFFFLVSLFAALILFLVSVVALSGDTTLSKLVGVAWAVDTFEKRILLVGTMCVIAPVAGVVAGMGLVPKSKL